MSIQDSQIDCVEIFKVALQKGINLFTGAGFSSLPAPDGTTLPDASELCKDICKHFSIDPKYKDDLEQLSNIVSIRYGDEFQIYLRKKFTVSGYNERYDVLNNIKLNAYITTNIDNIIQRTIVKLLQDGHQDIWVLFRPGDTKIDYFRDLGCHVIEGTTEELLDWIGENCAIEKEESFEDIDLTSLKPYLIPSQNSLEVVTQEDYYTNGCTHWFCVLSDYAYQTNNVNSLYEIALKSKNVIAVGIPYSGKTTTMMMIAAKVQANIKLILSNISVEEAQRVVNLLEGRPAFAFLDDCCNDVAVLDLLMRQANFTVIGFTDDYAFESAKHLFEGVQYERKSVDELTREEALGVYNKMPQSLRNASFKYKNSEDEKYSIFEFANLNIKNILSHKKIRNLLKRVKSASDATFQIIMLSAYLTCNKSCLNMDVLCSFFESTDYKKLRGYIELAQGFLREIDVTLSQDTNNQDYYELRSNLFARLTYDELKNHFKADFREVIRKFIQNVSPYKIYQHYIFKRSGYDAKLFSDLFGKDAYDLYECIYRFEDSEYTLQQQALYKAYQGDFTGAFADIDKALNKNRSNFSIKNSHAIILFEANKGKRTPIAEEGMSKAMETLETCFYSDKRKIYHAQKFAEFAIYLAKEWRKDDYLEQAKIWLEQIVRTGESQSRRTRDLLEHIRSQIADK